MLVARHRQFFAEEGIPADPVSFEADYRRFLGVGHWFVEGAEELLPWLRDRGYRLFLASNGVCDTQYSRIASAGIGSLFERIFISEEIGVNKPDREFFDRSLAQIPDFERERALIVGDSLTSDIRGGNNAGIRSCWFNYRRESPRAEIPADFEIRSLEELPPLLETLFLSCGDNC
jgi:2-haloacid dehalogenase